MLGTQASFGGILTLRSAVSGETLTRGHPVVYPFDSLRTAIDQRILFIYLC
jgi:hypothetical protein